MISEVEAGIPGPFITLVDIDDLGSFRPGWPEDDPDETVVHSMYEPTEPKTFYVWPPQPDPAGFIEIASAKIPDETDSADDVIEIDDSHIGELVDYTCYRALSQETEEGSLNKAMGFLNSMAISLGVDPETLRSTDPNART